MLGSNLKFVAEEEECIYREEQGRRLATQVAYRLGDSR